MITIILAILFGAIGGFGIMGILSIQAYDKGYKDGLETSLSMARKIIEEDKL